MTRARKLLMAGVALVAACPILDWRSVSGRLESGHAFAPRVAVAQASRARPIRYDVITVDNGGAIDGVVRWPGAIPEAATVKVPVPPAHQSACGCEEIGLERLIVDEETRGVRDAVVYLEGISSGKALPERDIDFTTGKKAKLDQVKCHYVPHVMVVRRGSTLAITSSDDILHNVHALMGLDDLFNLAFPVKGMVKDDPAQTSVGRRPGIVSLKCDAGHFWMNGSIFAVDHPYYSVTDEKGRFSLADVPPGEYTLKVWHENWEHRLLKNPAGQVVSLFFRGPVGLTEKVTVEAGKTASYEFDLSKAESIRRSPRR